ncbi:MAG TPA: hypothetical protein VGD40_00150 [Chryseosolibacter sp.]
MRFLKRITRSNFYIKLTNWEYWPFGILQFPIFFYYGWLSLRSRSLLFFTASNPGITMGGMFGESKYEILEKIPAHLKPRTILFEKNTPAEIVAQRMKDYGFTFPVIFKPDLGERGFMVKRISSDEDIRQYVQKVRVRFLIQELVDLPLEFGVFYCRKPSESTGQVVSIVMKEMLSITGDGKSTLQELILDKPRAKLQFEKLKLAYRDQLNSVIKAGKRIELVSIGNHALGTKFLNGNHLINDTLSSSFDHISKSIEGFYFGRFDLRCASVADLEKGNIKIVELNGCGAEPAHIYDPDFRLFDAVIVLFRHWRTIFEISSENRARGVPVPSFKEGKEHYRKFKEATRE